jgi:hypothetical protein
MWNLNKLKMFFEADVGQMATHIFWALAALILFWLHPVLVFPAWMITRKLEKYDWHIMDVPWASWKKCLIPIAVYVPIHLSLFG